MPEIQAILADTLEELKPPHRAANLAEWEAAQAGTPENNQRQQAAQTAYMRFWDDPGRDDWARRISRATGAPLRLAHFVGTLAA